MATSLGAYNHACTVDALVAEALALRGASVDILLCDGELPACQMSKMSRVGAADLAENGQKSVCAMCHAKGMRRFGRFGSAVRQYSDFLTEADRREAESLARTIDADAIRGYRHDGIPVGEHAFAGALRYFARGDLEGEPYADPILRKYFDAGLRTVAAMKRLFATERYDVVVAHHGIYIPQGMIGEMARRSGVRLVTWNPAYRNHCFIFSHHDTYHHTMISEPTETWDQLDLTPGRERLTLAYLSSRRAGTQDWIWFHDKPVENAADFLKDLGVDPDKPVIAALTSVVWDAQLHYKANAFPDMLVWLKETIRYFERRPDLQLLIRVHPAELRGMIPSRQRAADEIAKAFPVLPPNVFVLEPDNQASTYALCDAANATIIFNTKTGVEISAVGCRVIVAGEAWIRGKGFSVDASSREDYVSILDRLPWDPRLEAETRRRAQRYAFHFFFRRMIPLPFVEQSEPGRFVVRLPKDKSLAPGQWPGLDTICDGILTGSPFCYPLEAIDADAAASVSA